MGHNSTCRFRGVAETVRSLRLWLTKTWLSERLVPGFPLRKNDALVQRNGYIRRVPPFFKGPVVGRLA
jgi:hypothetical protein